MSTRTHKGRHRRPSKAGPAIAATTMSSAFVLGSIAGAAPAGAASADDFRRLRQCESGGNYRTNTGNGYYGAYQFALGTWRGLGYGGFPHQASPATQDAAARRLQARSGWGQWPGCARMLGLYGGGGQSQSTTRASRSARVYRATPAIKVLAKGTVLDAPKEPKWGFHQRTTGKPREDVRRWQLQMARRGWKIDVDGFYGQQSAQVLRKFVQEKKLQRTADQNLTEIVWNATWASPVT